MPLDFSALLTLVTLLAVVWLAVELRGLVARLSQVEQTQSQVSQGVYKLESGLAAADAVARSLVDATAAVRTELARAKNDLTALQTHASARQDLEQRTAESIRRLETIIAGTQSKGAAGENILEVVFAKLPAEWQVRDFRVGDRVVEFGLRLPNNQVVPIDSKWPATNLLEQYVACSDPPRRERLKSRIETAVLNRAREVTRYIEPSVTTSFGLAAVPDAVYDLCAGIQAEVFRLNVVLVSYSMFIPYLLLVFQMTLKTSRDIDPQRLSEYLESVRGSIEALQGEVEGRLAKACNMMDRSRQEMRGHLGKLGSGLASLQLSGAPGPAEPAPDPADEA